jgi:hypothetical protein
LNMLFRPVQTVAKGVCLIINYSILLGRDGMIVGFTTTYAISAFRNLSCEFESPSGRGVQHYVIKFVSDLRQVGGFLHQYN